MFNYNIRIFFKLSQKCSLKPDVIEYNPLSTPGLALILRLCMPKNAHTGMVLHFFCIQIFNGEKKDRPTDLPDFWAKRANKPFIFLGLIFDDIFSKFKQLPQEPLNQY